jgi:hypothetical protein
LDKFFSLSGKEAMLISGLIGVFVYIVLLGGSDDQGKIFYISFGFGTWAITKFAYWKWRVNSIVKLSNSNFSATLLEIEKIRKINEPRAEEIEFQIFYNRRL